MGLNDPADQPAPRSHLFTLRLWPEELGSDQTDWRGKVQHVNSGEARYFRDWPALEAFVEGLLSSNDPERPDSGTAGHAGSGGERERPARDTERPAGV